MDMNHLFLKEFALYYATALSAWKFRRICRL